MINDNKPGSLIKNYVFILLIIFSIIISFAGYIYYRHEENAILEEKYNELKAIADLKMSQVTYWQKNRLTDATSNSRSSFFIKAVEHFLANKNNKPLADEIVKRLVLINNLYNYENVFLTDTSNKILLSATDKSVHLESETQSKVADAEKSRQITLTDFFPCKFKNEIHYDIIAPLVNNNNRTIAVLIMRYDPEPYLFPLIQSWPTPSKSSETILLRRERNYVLFLNELRHQANTAMKIKIPLSNKDLPAVHAALGYTGIFSGKDYRGVKILAYTSPVAGTSWFMAAKVDTSEIFRDLNYKALTIIVVSSLMLLFLWMGLAYIYTSRQKNIFKDLWQAQEEARTTLYSIGDGVLITDENGNVKQLNHVTEQLTGWTEKEAGGKPLEEVFNIINEENRMEVVNPIRKVLKDGVTVELSNHTLLVSKNGEEIPIADSGAPIKNQKGDIIGAVLVFRDQTKERAKQKIIEESEAKYRSLFYSTNDGICLHEVIFNKEGNPVNYILLEANKKYEEITGIKRENIINKKATEIYQTDTAPYLDVFARVALTGEPYYFESYFEPMKKYFAISVYSPGEGKFATIFQEITLRKQYEENQRRRVEEVETLMEVAPVAIWISDDAECNKIHGNRMANSFYEAEQKENVSANESSARRFFRNGIELKPEELTMQEAAAKNMDIRNSELDVLLPSGKWLYMLGSASPLRDVYGNVRGCISAFMDLTEKREAQIKLEKTLEELKRSNKDLEQFAYVASHDLQEPIRMIKSYTDLLTRRISDKLDGDEKVFFGYISDGAVRMNQLVSALLGYSRLSSHGKEFKTVDCNEIISEVLQDLKSAIDDAKGKIICEDLPYVKGDKVMLRQLFQNLLQNAIKFRDKNNPVILISSEKKDNYVTIKIKDNGIGIDPEYHDKIFIIFQKLHPRDKYPGTGIGLALCKKIVELHGGQICLDSEPGRGTTFIFTLPLDES